MMCYDVTTWDDTSIKFVQIIRCGDFHLGGWLKSCYTLYLTDGMFKPSQMTSYYPLSHIDKQKKIHLKL